MPSEQGVPAPRLAVPWKGDYTQRCISSEAVFSWVELGSAVAQVRPGIGDGISAAAA